MRSILTAIALASLASLAQAQTTVGIHLISHHFPQRDYQHNVNPGVYVRTENGFTAGVYRNTLNRTSVYAGLTLERSLTDSISVAITGGAITGYRKDANGYGFSNGALSPMLAPSIRWGYARVSFIPGIGVTSSVVHLSLETTL